MINNMNQQELLTFTEHSSQQQQNKHSFKVYPWDIHQGGIIKQTITNLRELKSY